MTSLIHGHKVSATPVPEGVRVDERMGGVLLAAGSGSRMGLKPKSLLELDGVPLIHRTLAALCGAGLTEVVVVLGAYAEHLAPLVRDFPVKVVNNLRHTDGQVSSLRLGLGALHEPLDSVMVALADQPLLDVRDFQDLMAAYLTRPANTQVLVPTVQGLPGNPVVFSAAVRTAVLAAGPEQGCKQWQARHPAAVHHWETSNTRYRQDVDSPQDLEQLATQTGQRLKWPLSWQDKP